MKDGREAMTRLMQKNSSTRGLWSRSGYRAIASIALAAITVVAAGCGMAKVGYRNGDTVGLFLINRYLDLSSEQKEFVKPRLRALLAWHRKTQLPDYAAFATGLQARATQSITARDIETLGEQSRRKAITTIDHAIPDLADLALRLTPDNIATLKAKFVEDDEKWRDENLSGSLEKRQKKRYEKTLERVEEWYGSLSREQRATLRQLSDARPFDNDILVAERQRRQQELIDLLTRVERDKPSRDAVIASMKSYAERFEPSPVAERRSFVDSLHRATDEMNAQVHNFATPAQRARAAAKLQEYIDDFRNLASESA